jgi:polyhydroxyalkanoate synthesis regulator phasin|tara:strand:- start:453 stop:683 length:231 start_codon:yes stop_codon:yes gene_type:complete
MNDKNLSEAIKNIIEKELKAISKLLPKEVISNIESKISPQVEKIIDQSGYIKKSKYKNLEKIINELENRISELEKN